HLRELVGELDSLRLAAGDGRRGLAELQVAHSELVQDAQLEGDQRHVREEARGVLDRHVEHLGDRLAAVADLERLLVEASALASLAENLDLGHELERGGDQATAGADLAAATLVVEAEAPDRVAAAAALGRGCEERADRVPD